MKRLSLFALLVMLLLPVLPLQSKKVTCLFSFYVKPSRFRGGYVVSDRTIIYRNAQYYGKFGSGSYTRFSGYYLVRFTFFRPVSPVAAKTDGGSAYVRVNTKHIMAVPPSDKNFKRQYLGKTIDVFTSSKPSYVKLIVRGDGIARMNNSNKKSPRKPRKYTRRKIVVGSAHVAMLWRSSAKNRKADQLRQYFGKRKVFLKLYMRRRRIFKFVPGSTAYGILQKDIEKVARIRIRTGFNKVLISLQLRDRTKSVITLEKNFTGWLVSSYKKMLFVLPNQYDKYRRRRYRSSFY